MYGVQVAYCRSCSSLSYLSLNNNINLIYSSFPECKYLLDSIHKGIEFRIEIAIM
jgi:hypothetical protein